MTGFEPDFAGAGVFPSPNFGERSGGRAPDMVILHYTGMPTAEGAFDWLRQPESQVSSHYFVFRGWPRHPARSRECPRLARRQELLAW